MDGTGNNPAPGKNVQAPTAPEAAAAPGTDWASLAWVTLLVGAGLSAFEILEHYLFPHLNSVEHQAVTVCAGTIAAVVGTYLATRRLDSALSLHAEAEKKLAMERNVLRTVTDNIPDSIFAKDATGHYLLANKAFATLHGMKSPDDLLGKTAFDLFPKDRATALHADDLQVMKPGGKITETERTAVDAEGNVKVLLTTKVPLIDQSQTVVGIVGLHRDITRRKEAEQKLRHSEANLAAAQRIAHFGSVELDLANLNNPDQKSIQWSDEVFRIFGYDPGTQEPSREAFLRGVHPEDKEHVQKSLENAIRDARPYFFDFRIIRPDGAVRNIHERGDVILNPKTRQPAKLVASIQDITDRLQAEICLQNANRDLAEKVQELEQRSKEIHLLSEMGGRLQSCKNVEEAFVEIGNVAEQLFPKWSGALCITSPSRTVVETVADWGKEGGGERVFAPDDCWALRQGQPQSFRRGQRTAPCRHIDPGKVTESLCVPFMAQNEALGIVSLQMIAGAESSGSASIFARIGAPACGGSGQAGGAGAWESAAEGDSQKSVDLRSADGAIQSAVHGRIAGAGVQPGQSEQGLCRDRHDGPGPFQEVQRYVWPSGRRRSASHARGFLEEEYARARISPAVTVEKNSPWC